MKFELIRDVIDVIVTFKNKQDPNKNNSAVRGRIWLKLELIRDVIDVIVTFNNKQDPNKNESSRMATTLNIDFSHSQRQITL